MGGDSTLSVTIVSFTFIDSYLHIMFPSLHSFPMTTWLAWFIVYIGILTFFIINMNDQFCCYILKIVKTHFFVWL